MIETILFDLDDTLIAEMEWARGGWAVVARHLAKAVGREPGELETWMQGYFATDRRHVLDQLAARLGLGTPELDTCIELYRTEPRELTVVPDAVAALELAAARRSGIVTDGALRTQQTKVRCAGLTGAVEAIVYTDQLGPGAGKPSPDGFREALRRLGSEAETAVYIADNAAKDFAGPRALGMRSVQIRRGDGVYDGVEAPADGEPDAVISSLLDLEALLESWS
ncbi:MAG TPA: HAD family hydrolase [Solirubrobacteraceae bacterium]|nr:HAD family hydrolase [Solirubrobacteraceae bacterium]